MSPPPSEPVPATSRALIATAARLLFVNGETSEGVRTEIERLGDALGVRTDALLFWGEIILVMEGAPSPVVLRARPTGVDMGKVAAALDLLDRIRAGDVTPAEGLAQIEAIAARPPASTPRFALMAALGAAALAVIFGADSAATIGIIFASAGTGALLRRGLARLSGTPLIQPFAAAFLAGVAGFLAMSAGIGVDPRLVLVCPCMVLVPGPHLLNGAIDLARARIAIGTARIVFAGLIVLMISAGLLIGLTLSDHVLPTTGPAAAVPFLVDVAAAGLAVAAYGTFFSMPWSRLPIPILIGMAAHGARWWLLSLGVGLSVASLAACLIVGTAVTLITDRLRYPFAAFAFASVVSMIPGIFLFDAAAGLLAITSGDAGNAATELVTVAADGTNAVLIILAMTVGVIVPKMTIGGWQSRRRGG